VEGRSVGPTDRCTHRGFPFPAKKTSPPWRIKSAFSPDLAIERPFSRPFIYPKIAFGFRKFANPNRPNPSHSCQRYSGSHNKGIFRPSCWARLATKNGLPGITPTNLNLFSMDFCQACTSSRCWRQGIHPGCRARTNRVGMAPNSKSREQDTDSSGGAGRVQWMTENC